MDVRRVLRWKRLGRLYLWGSIGAVVPGLPGQPLLLLVQWLGLQDHLLQLKGGVTVQTPPLREEQSAKCTGAVWEG